MNVRCVIGASRGKQALGAADETVQSIAIDKYL
jgi:hypothetical protein